MITKEQVVSEKWELTDIVNLFFGSGRIFIKKISNDHSMMDAHNICYYLILEQNKIRVIKNMTGGFSGGDNINEQLFFGSCEDVNEFRYISKLIGV